MVVSVPAFAQTKAPVQPQENERAQTPNGNSANTTVNKNQFNLFNPTPDDLMRPFCTDRPGKAHCAQTVDAGHFQEEGDIWISTWDHWSPTRISTRAYTVINPNLKLGITNWTELDVLIPVYNNLEIKSRVDGGVHRAAGFADFSLGGKINFFGNDGGDQALGAIGFVKIPTAASGLGNNRTELFLDVPFTTALPDKFSLTLEPAVNLLRNLRNQGYQGDYQFIANLNRPIIGTTVTAAVEIALDFPADHNIRPRHTIDPSLQWLVTPNLQLDAGAYIGITKAAPDYTLYVGVSFRY
jgi:Putative MetA-pathway of phenol degradation